MARTSTINIRRTSRGTTIRATGEAAQALCNVINHAAEIVAHPIVVVAPARVPIRLVIAVSWAGNTYHARAIASCEALAAGLKNLKAASASGEVQVIDALLNMASPRLKRLKVISINYQNCQDEPRLYTIDAEVA